MNLKTSVIENYPSFASEIKCSCGVQGCVSDFSHVHISDHPCPHCKLNMTYLNYTKNSKGLESFLCGSCLEIYFVFEGKTFKHHEYEDYE